jgi:hypothetical protein
VFKVDYTVEVAGNKEFGSLFLQHGQQQENVALTIVQSGWAKVNLDGQLKSTHDGRGCRLPPECSVLWQLQLVSCNHIVLHRQILVAGCALLPAFCKIMSSSTASTSCC